MSKSAEPRSPLADTRWVHSGPELREALEALRLRGWPAETLLTEGERRRLTVVEPAAGSTSGRLLLKHFRNLHGRRPASQLKRWLGRSSAEREFRALTRLRGRGLAIPEALGLGRLPNADWLLVLRHIEGRPLEDALASCGEASALLEVLGDAVADLHEAGASHGDLHIGNVLVTEKGPALLDFQAAGRAGPRAVLRDVGSMDFSLAHHGVAEPARACFRRAALRGREDALPRVEAFARRHRHGYYRSRTRRCTQPGRQYARTRVGEWKGMRMVDFSEQALESAIEAHRTALSRGGPSVLKCDHRSRVSCVSYADRELIVKEVTKGGLVRQLADTLRGSPARRAWIGGHGLGARGIGVARPLAFVELRDGLASRASMLVMEDLRPALPTGAFLGTGGTEEREAAIDALCELVVRLHDTRVVHGDLQAHHVYLSRGVEGMKAALIDLEGVRFPRRLRDAERVEALSELNASLADGLVSSRERREGFARYAAALPFRDGEQAALRQIVARSLERGHFWSGEDCEASVSVRPGAR